MGVQYIDLGYNATGTVQTIRVGKDISLFGAHAVTPVAPTISVSANTINANEMYVNVTITSNVDWSMVVSTGTTIGTYTGSGDTELQVNVGQNIDRSGNGSARIIEFVVTNEAGSASTSVVQSKTYVIVGTYQSTGATTQRIAYNPVYFSVDDEVSITYSAGYNFQDADAHTIKIYVYEPNPRKQYWFDTNCNYLDLTIPDFESFLDLYQDVPEGGSAQNYVSYLYPSTGLTGNASLTGITFNGTGLIGPQVWILTNSGGFYFPTAFSNCNALQSVTMINCGGIAWASFVGCTALTDVTITSTRKTIIGKNAFMSPAISMPGQGFDDYYCPISALTISGATLNDGAFAGSSALTSATLNSVAFYGNGHFGNCTALVDVTMTLHPSVIGQKNTFANIFSGCTSMVRLNSNTDGEFVIPWGFTNMGGKVFDRNANLVTLVIPRSMTGFTANGACSAATNLNAMYASDAQGNRSGSANTIFIHNALTLPSEGNFKSIKGTNAFKNVVFEGGRSSVCSIGTGQFRESTKLSGVTGTSEVDWSYGTALFSKCTGLVRVDGWSVPTNWPHESNTRAVRGTSFAACTKFQYFNTDGSTDVVVPEGVEKIGPSAFSGCTAITSVDLPSTLVNNVGYVATLDVKAPFAASGVNKIISRSATEPPVSSTSFTGMSATGVLYTPAGADYTNWLTYLGTGWTQDSIDNLPGDVEITYVGDSMPMYILSSTGVSNIDSMSVDGVIYEPTQYFTFTGSGRTVRYYRVNENGTASYFPGNVVSIVTNQALGGFTSNETITAVTVNAPGKTIGGFAGCTSLVELNLVALKGFYANAFQNCTSLTSVTIPEGCTAVRLNCFAGCTGLTSLYIPSTLGIASSAFSGLTSLTSLTVNKMQAPTTGYFSGAASGTLYVPQGATGYEDWLAVLGEGWSLSYITP